jgi:uncharacterized protein (DUF1684 family)
VDEWRLVYNGEEIFKINEKAEIVARSSSWDKGECKIFNEHRFSKFMMEVGVKMKNENKFSDNKLKYYTESDEQWSAIFHRAISKAIENNRKHGVPNTYCRNGKIVFEMPDGTITDKNPFI